jgi:hypothetical protein
MRLCGVLAACAVQFWAGSCVEAGRAAGCVVNFQMAVVPGLYCHSVGMWCMWLGIVLRSIIHLSYTRLVSDNG